MVSKRSSPVPIYVEYMLNFQRLLISTLLCQYSIYLSQRETRLLQAVCSVTLILWSEHFYLQARSEKENKKNLWSCNSHYL